jgi:hypothetical protein
MKPEHQDQHSTDVDREQLARIEAKLGIPSGYYLSLREDGTDWEFAIKLMVLLESALGRVIAEHLHNPAINDHCESLSMGGRTGKVALAKALGIIDEPERRTFLALAEIRNAFAHRVENITGNFHEFGARLEPRRLQQYLKDCLTVPDPLADKVSFLWREPSPALLRAYMWMGGNNLLISLAYQDEAAEKERARRSALESASKPTTGKPFSLADLFPRQGPTLLTASPDELKPMLDQGPGTN